jgi:cation diffusion facilitator CzcD-associated flavoprotein CzcO
VDNPNAVIVGAGPAGLACAASMGALGLKAIILEKSAAVGSVWRRHYDRLHLHTPRGHSDLPRLAMPQNSARFHRMRATEIPKRTVQRSP